MTSHDQHFKRLLRTFFRPFLAAFVPDLHRDLGPEAIAFLDKELVGKERGGQRTKLVDLVARVRLRGEASFVLVHVEHQARRDARIGWRLLCYGRAIDGSLRTAGLSDSADFLRPPDHA